MLEILLQIQKLFFLLRLTFQQEKNHQQKTLLCADHLFEMGSILVRARGSLSRYSETRQLKEGFAVGQKGRTKQLPRSKLHSICLELFGNELL